jgi:hypothetical protein
MPDRALNPILADDRSAGIRALRRHHRATLQHHERVAEVKFVLEAATRQIVMPVEPGFASDDVNSLLLWLPAESDWDMQAVVNPQPIDRPEGSEAVDRWKAYHGTTSLTVWVRGEIEGVKTAADVFLIEDVQVPNPLGREEYGLIRRANADRTALAAACKLHAATLVTDPLCVGADPYGIDVRARFGIVRLEFPPGIQATTPARCQEEVDRLLGAAAKSAAKRDSAGKAD